MKTRMLMKTSAVSLASLCLLLSACQPGPRQLASSGQNTFLPLQTQLTSAAKPQTALSTAPSAKVRIEPETTQAVRPDQRELARITLEITMPPAPKGDFSTQALAVNNIAKLQLELTGPGIPTPLYATGADVNGMIDNTGGTFSVSFSNVPYGKARRLSLRAYDGSSTEIPGASIKTAFAVGGTSTDVELSFRTTPLADILAVITGSQANQYLAENLDLIALQAFVDNLTGMMGTSPNYSYSTHPSLIDGAAIGADLIANGGTIGALNPATVAYKIGTGSVSYTLSGLINPDVASVVVRDPASGEIGGRSNGTGTITGIRPGTWKVEATAPGYTASSSPTVVVSTGDTAEAGTIDFSISNTPAISALSVSSGVIGSSLTISGSNFHSSIAGNTVDFGGVVATITSASTTELVVTVPGGISGSQNVRVTVGGNASNSQSFSVTPVISSLSVSSGIVGSNVTLTGTGFSGTLANNTVKLNGVNATVITASGTELVVTVPQAASGDFTVQVGSQTSSGQAFNVLPTVSLSAPAADALLSGTSTLSVTTTSGNAISKVEYFSGAAKLGESISPPYSFDWDTSTAASGAHSLSAKITDAEDNTATSVSVNVTVNHAPIISSLTATLNPVPGLAHTTQLSCSATDAEDSVTLSWETVGGSFGTFSSSTGAEVFWTAPATAGGPYTIRCSANDGHSTTIQELNVSVNSETGNITGNGGLF